MKRILIDVDTQEDFVAGIGSMYVPVDNAVLKATYQVLRTASETYDAVIGSVDSHAYDAWEFKENGGPFPSHCVKGTPGWLRVWQHPTKTRFIPMTSWSDGGIVAGEAKQGGGRRLLTAHDLAQEAVEGNVGLYFEKEVYSLWDNPAALPIVKQIGTKLGGDWSNIQIDIIGYCTGGYCVDAAAEGLRLQLSRANVRVLAYATAALGGNVGAHKSKQNLTQLGVEWVESP